MNIIADVAETVEWFNSKKVAYAHLNFAGHVEMLSITVDRLDSDYSDPDEEDRSVYYQYAYMNKEYGKQRTPEALLAHFVKWIEENHPEII